MSTRTIIEINHDYLRRIADDPEKLIAFVRRLGASRGEAEKIAPYGIKVLTERHHSEEMKLQFKGTFGTRTTVFQ